MVSFAPPAPTSPTPRERLEVLLRTRKLDRTLTSALPDRLDADAVAPFGVAALDTQGLGGIPRGQLSELVGPASSGRTSLAWAWLGAATARGEEVALIDTFDRFDPVSGVACGLDVTRLLWVRGQALTRTAGALDPAWLPGARAVEGPGTLIERTIDRALKALNLVLQSGVCTAVVFDCVDVPLGAMRCVPRTTWLRVQRIIDGTDIACLMLSPISLARSAGGMTIDLGAGRAGRAGRVGRAGGAGGMDLTSPTSPTRPTKPKWSGEHDRSRRLAGLSVTARVTASRCYMEGTVRFETRTESLEVSRQCAETQALRSSRVASEGRR